MPSLREKLSLPRRRTAIEECYASILAPFAVHWAAPDSRAYPDDNSAEDNRGAFQRDRDRIIHTRAFRRLMYKTQLFLNYEGDYFRTRLTHALEVSQLSRGVCRSLALNEHLAEAIALGHDLGHTPFGHAVERYFDGLFQSQGCGRFFHNEQSLRIVDLLERRTAQGPPGLNLTREVREGILKHNSNSSGAYPALSPGLPCSSVEGQVVAVVDTLAYLCHDLEDVVTSGYLAAAMHQSQRVHAIFTHLKELVGSCTGLSLCFDAVEEPFFIRSLTHFLITALTEDTLAALETHGVDSREKVRALAAQGVALVGFSGEHQAFFSALRQDMLQGVYQSHPVAAMDHKAVAVVQRLTEACLSTPKLMPPDWYDQYEACADGPSRLRVVCDYLSCMTDRSAVDESERLFNPRIKIY